MILFGYLLSNDLPTPNFGLFATRPHDDLLGRVSQTCIVWHHCYAVPFLCLEQPLLLRCTHDVVVINCNLFIFPS